LRALAASRSKGAIQFEVRQSRATGLLPGTPYFSRWSMDEGIITDLTRAVRGQPRSYGGFLRTRLRIGSGLRRGRSIHSLEQGDLFMSSVYAVRRRQHSSGSGSSGSGYLGAGLQGRVRVSPSGLGKDRSFRGCAFRYLRVRCTYWTLAPLAKPEDRGSEGDKECEDGMRDRRDP
jgi:hypothetical protein